MKIKSQVCSLDLSKKLKELGFQGSSHFVYITDGNIVNLIDEYPEFCFVSQGGASKDGLKYLLYPHEQNAWQFYNAYTASELLDIIPEVICTKNIHYRINITLCSLNDNDKDMIFKRKYLIGYHIISFEDECLASAAAKMLIYLIENGYYKND